MAERQRLLRVYETESSQKGDAEKASGSELPEHERVGGGGPLRASGGGQRGVLSRGGAGSHFPCYLLPAVSGSIQLWRAPPWLAFASSVPVPVPGREQGEEQPRGCSSHTDALPPSS